MPIPNNLIFISAQPHDQYFQWQVEVQIVNFRKFGISDKMHVLIWYPKEGWDKGWITIMEKYPEVKLFLYEDKGVDLGLYIPQLRPHILKQHFLKYEKDFKSKIFFYCDSDIIFNKLPNFELLCQDNINYVSNTTSYLDYTYLTQKEKEGNIPFETVIKQLAEIGGIDSDIIKRYDRITGGAQTLLKGIDSIFWDDVEKDSIAIRKYLWYGYPDSINKIYFANEDAGFQSWCADMWALNFNLWKRNKETRISSELDFSWATDSLDTFYKKPIYHNAGAGPNNPEVFFKGQWIHVSPIGKNIQIPNKYASYAYVEAINNVK